MIYLIRLLKFTPWLLLALGLLALIHFHNAYQRSQSRNALLDQRNQQLALLNDYQANVLNVLNADRQQLQKHQRALADKQSELQRQASQQASQLKKLIDENNELKTWANQPVPVVIRLQRSAQSGAGTNPAAAQ